MSLLDRIVDGVSAQASQLSPLTLSIPSTSAPVLELSKLIHHLTTTPIHPVYLPYLRFGAIHAIRVTTVWAGLTNSRKKEKGVGLAQDLFGYLTMAWGGSSVVSLLLGQPPSWLISPTPWILYTAIYLLLIPTGLSKYIVSTAPKLLFNLFTAYVDGLTRGTTISAIPSLIGSSSLAATANWWTPIVLSAIAVSSGGVLVQLFGLHQDEWKLGTPAVLHGGLLSTLDVWGPALIGLIYAALQGHYGELSPITDALATVLPNDVKIGAFGTSIVDPAHARAISVLFLGTLLAARVIIQASKGNGKAAIAKKAQVTKKTELTISGKGEKEQVLKTPVKVKPDQTGTSKVTPRKSPRAKSK